MKSKTFLPIITGCWLMVICILASSCAKEGPQGIPGPQGDSGSVGPSGVPGSQIYGGTGAPATSLGSVGDYYLDKSSGKFYGPKTSSGWGTPILLGAGGSGSQGPAGPQGPQGPPGAAGPQGPGGSTGPQGPQGPAGPAGATGATGAAGAAGATGAAGSQIYSGNGTPASTLGKAGDYYIDDTHAVIYGPKTATGWPSTGLSLQVNTTITYNFVNKVQYNLPYSWMVPIANVFTGTADQILLPYNSTAAHTAGFTIPQSIVDNGTVLAYIRYFLSGPNDTATDAGLSAWQQLPYSTNGYINGVFLPVNLNTGITDNSFNIYLNSSSSGIGTTYAGMHIPATIRIVLIPEGQMTQLQSIRHSMEGGVISGTEAELFNISK